MALRKTPREKALGIVEEMDAQAAKWTTERDSARSELAALELTIGEDALAGDVSAGQLAARLTVLRDRADIAQRAVQAATGKALEARRDATRSEGAEMSPGIELARSALAAHDVRVAGLLKALTDFSGEDYTPESALPYDPSLSLQGPRTMGTPARWALADTLAGLERAQAVLFALADGPASGFEPVVDQAAQFRAELVEAESALAEAQSLVDELQSKGGAGLVEAQRAVRHLVTEVDNCRGYVTTSAA